MGLVVLKKSWLVFFICGFTSLILTAQNVVTERVFTQVEEMPRYWECASSTDNMYRLDKCTLTALKKWFLENMNYPSEALSEKTEGIVKVYMIIDTFGNMTNPVITQHLSSQCDEEAFNLISILDNKIELWYPGRQARRKVRVAITIPVEFSLKDWNAEQVRRQKLMQEAAEKKDSLNIPVPTPKK